MASTYLAEVLCSEESHVPNIRAKITELTNHLNALKSDVRTVVEDGSIQFSPLVKENNRLQSKAEELLKDMTSVEEELDEEVKQELTSVADELDNLSHSLKEVNVFLKTLKQLVEINSQLKSAREKMERQEFYESTKIIKSIQEMIKTNSEKLNEVKIFRVLSQEVVLSYEELIYQISEIWSQCVNVSQKENLSGGCDEVTISIDVQSEDEISQILKASHCLKTVLIEKKFSKTLLDILKRVIVKKSKLNVKVDSKAILVIEISRDEAKPNYLEVFQNIKTIFEFLKSHINVEVDDSVTFLSEIGDCIADDFAESLIKNCLSETIPSNSRDLEKYKDVIENAKTFDESLQEIGFRLGDSSSILNYAKNINVLFANKLCQSYLSKARTIMKKDLHNIVNSDDVVSDVRVLPPKVRNILKMKMNIQDEVFSFPKCQISKQADEIMSLIRSMMDEVEKSLDLYAVRLFYTVRNIFEMYSAVVPLHHKKFLETLPQQTAIFHNNCMYFAHNLINLATEYFNKIPSVLNDHFTILLEEAVILRSLAAETLETSVTNQRNQLIFILRDSGLAVLNENPKLDPNSEKNVRQCLRQLQLLQTVWGDVLPVNVYNRAIGFLLDSIVEEVITLIISVEDISSQTASDLASIFRIVLERGPSLFPDAREVHRHSKKWQKFKEFILVLEGSLRDIDDRWANGMGPLAIEFTPEQVKHLIRALFQNSDRRAALLARIR